MIPRKCKQCYRDFDAKRTDHYFCSGKCVAQFYRDNPNPQAIHRDLPHDKPHVCEWCGVLYSVNDYAERGGKRTLRYCSGKCKQAAYRARCQEARKQARRRYESEQRQEQRQEQRYEYRENRHNGQQQTAGSTGMTLQRAWIVLGVSPNAPQGAVKAARNALMKRYHPDVYKGDDATALSQEVNAAFACIRKYAGW